MYDEVGTKVFAYGITERKLAADRISQWASARLFVLPYYQTAVREHLQALPFKARIATILNGFYKTLILSYLRVPGGAADRLARALLGIASNENMSCIHSESTKHIIEQGPLEPINIHEVTFANSAAMFTGEHDGHLYFLNARRLAPPPHIFKTAIMKLLSVFSLFSTFERLCLATGASQDEIIPHIENVIADIHKEKPFYFMNAKNIKMTLKEFKDTVFDPALASLKA